jgi:hypothetical protein
MNGINGLLGLGGNAAYADNSFNSSGGVGTSSYIDAAKDQMDEGFIDLSSLKGQMDAALVTENAYLNLINTTAARATAVLRSRGLGPTGARIATSSIRAGDYDVPSATLVNLISTLNALRPGVQTNVNTLTALIATYNTADTAASAVRPAGEIRQDAVLDYLDLSTSGILTNEAERATKETEWNRLFP